MTAALYRESAPYRRHLDDADDALRPHTGDSVRDLILDDDPGIHRTRWAQPALFAVGYALTRTLAELGVVPDAVLGHGTGEYAAAVAAGTLGLADAARLVTVHAAAADALPAGGLLAVRGAEAEIAGVLADHPGLFLAAVDGPRDTVLSGPADLLERAAEALAGCGLRTRRLRAGHSCHGPAAAAVADRLAAEPGPAASAPARIALASARYGRMLGDEAMDTAYWAGLAVEPVRFADALSALVAETAPTCLVEIGPAPHLLRLAERADLPPGVRLLHPAPGRAACGSDLADTLGGLYLSGVEPCWDALYEPAQRRTERLAPYVFSDARRFWRTTETPATETPAGTPATGTPAAAAGPADPGTPVARPRQSAAPGAAAGTPRNPVLAAVIDAVVEVGEYPREQVDAQARFYEDLGFDSVMIMQLKDRIEQRLPQAAGITVQQLLPALRSVGSLAALVQELTSVGATA
ncbi:acyltransferase domain-containing protein (plasmid) [Streptomyces galilaeus]